MIDPYDDDIYNNDSKTPLNAISPPLRDDVFRDFLTDKDRQASLAQHIAIAVKPRNKVAIQFRTDKKIACIQKPTFIQNTEKSTKDWAKHTSIQLEKSSILKLDKYCLKMINDRLSKAKAKIAELDAEALSSARLLANPFESVGCSIFMNRAAVKMASLDQMYSLIDRSKKSLVFADLCGGPGGFTEYLNWRCQQNKMSCKGFGITLKGNQDWDMYSFKAVKSSSIDFKTHYGADASGDLYNVENSKSFAALVLKDTKNAGVDLVVADGGFSVKGDEEYQEEHSKLLFVAQTAASLRILRKGGSFVLKVFDMLTDFSVDLFYLLYLHFENVSICKPFASRPANSERYLVCLNLLEAAPKDLIEFLETVQKQLVALKPTDAAAKSGHVKHQPGFISKHEKVDLGLLDLNRLLDQEFVAKDEAFVDAIEGSNMKLATKQKDALEDLYLYATNPSQLRYDQEGIANACCKEWGIPLK